MSGVDDFLADILPRLREAEIALHSGDAGPRSVYRFKTRRTVPELGFHEISYAAR